MSKDCLKRYRQSYLFKGLVISGGGGRRGQGSVFLCLCHNRSAKERQEHSVGEITKIDAIEIQSA